MFIYIHHDIMRQFKSIYKFFFDFDGYSLKRYVNWATKLIGVVEFEWLIY